MFALTLSQVATIVSLFVGTPVTIECEKPWPYPSASGYAYLREPVVYIRPDHCYALRHVRQSQIAPVAWAISTLAHELRHAIDGVEDESVAQCLGLAQVHDLALALGASERRARRLERTAISMSKQLPPRYNDPNCAAYL